MTMPQTVEELTEHYRREAATTYPITLTHDEYCAVIAAHAILHDIVCGIRYTKKPHLERINNDVVKVLMSVTRRAEQSAVAPIEDGHRCPACTTGDGSAEETTA